MECRICKKPHMRNPSLNYWIISVKEFEGTLEKNEENEKRLDGYEQIEEKRH